jgi:hypothetical protein
MWRAAGFTDIETRTIRIAVEFSDFDDFWRAMSGPAGPTGKTIRQLAPAKLEELQADLRERLPPAPDSRIVYEAIANAIKGRKAG